MAEKARDILEMIWNFPRFFRVFSPAGGIFRNSEPVWCPHCFLCLLFPGKGKRTAFSFCFSKKKMPGKRKETEENFRMLSPDPFYRPEPCSGLAAYGSRRIYDRLCRGRCRAQLFATKERYRCGLPLADTHQPAFLNPFFSFSLRKKRKRAFKIGSASRAAIM